jgi:hypothetical protein
VSSVSRYASFAQGKPLRVAVSDTSRARSLLDATEEQIPNFADIELVESDDPGLYFRSKEDDDGLRWASRLQTWLELQAGDARQQSAARDLRRQLEEEYQP